MQSKVTEEAQMAYQGLVENPSPDITQVSILASKWKSVTYLYYQLMHGDNPLRMLRSGHLPVLKTRSRTATIPSASHSKAADRRSIPDSSEISKSGVFKSNRMYENCSLLIIVVYQLIKILFKIINIHAKK